MPKGGRLPLDFFVIGESTPVFQDEHGLLAALFLYYFLRRAGFNMMSPAVTGKHPSLCKASSP
jgi:hypothetical protein